MDCGSTDLACSGATSIGLTDNLNFGNPHKPESFYQLRAAVEGISEGCLAFDIPVTGGNVSLYNESQHSSIDPTPTVAVVGLIDDRAHITTSYFKEAGDVIFLLGNLGDELGGSHYLLVSQGRKEGLPPRIDFDHEKKINNQLLTLIRADLVRSAHDCSEGGLAVTISESCFKKSKEAPLLGASISLGKTGLRPDVALFNETSGRIVFSAPAAKADHVEKLLRDSGAPFHRLGVVTETPELSIEADGVKYEWNTRTLHNTWSTALPHMMQVG